MKANRIWANLTVADIARTIEFYTKLGFRHNGALNAAVGASFVFGEHDFVINFFRAERMEKAMGGPAADLRAGSEVMFSLSAASKDEVAEWARAAEAAGGTVFTPPGEDEHGYYGCGFADPDGHKFNLLVM